MIQLSPRLSVMILQVPDRRCFGGDGVEREQLQAVSRGVRGATRLMPEDERNIRWIGSQQTILRKRAPLRHGSVGLVIPEVEGVCSCFVGDQGFLRTATRVTVSSGSCGV